MKKTITIIAMMLMAFVAQAQTEHMKFMGIPLDGSIEQFTTKLLNKGMTKDIAHSKASEGMRVFNGTFFDRSATIVVWYDKRTLTVYSALAQLEFSSGEEADEFISNIKRSITNKYFLNVDYWNDWEEDEKFGRPFYYMYLYSETRERIGNICIWYDKFNVVSVNYYDYSNGDKHDQNLNDDL